MKALVSLIIVNYNGMKLLPECLRAIRRQSYPSLEIIVVDNGSSDDSPTWLRRQKGIHLIALEKNLGFSGGNLQGYRRACGQYLALLNNDAVPSPHWLTALIRGMETNPVIGICASKVLRYDNPEVLDAAGDGCTASGSGFKRGSGKPASLFNANEYVFGATAAAVLYRRAMLDEIGFLDPDFFLNAEDSDLNFRAQMAGWKCLYVADAVVRHHVSATIALDPGQGLFYDLRNDEWVWIKNMPLGLMLRYAPHKIAREINTFIHYAVKKGQWAPWFNGKRAALLGLGEALRKRSALKPLRKASNDYLKSMLSSNFETWLSKQRGA